MRKITVWLLLLAATFLTACGGTTTVASEFEGRLNVVATTGQIGDAVANVAGDAVELTTLFGPGIDPHLYVPTEGDVTTFSQANVIFYNGLHLEAQMLRMMDQMDERGIVVVAIGDSLPEDELIAWDANFPHDPHVWNDPSLWKQGVELIRDTLIEADPANEEQYRANTAVYLAEIDAADQFVQEQIARIPDDKRVLISAHDAFAYFARTYSLEERGLQGISTESEAGTQDVQALAELIVSREIPAIFVESSVPRNTIEAVQAAAGAQGFDVVIGGQLYSDALGDPGTPEGTYVGMRRHNAQTLADALSQ